MATSSALTGPQPDPVEPAEETEVYDLPCSYTARKDAPNLSQDQSDYDWDRYPACARLGPDRRLRIDPAHLERALFEDGFAEILIHFEGWYYVRADGTSLHVINFDFAPDAWSEGLARGMRDGQITYFNRQFEEVTSQRYDWGWPFENGHALVCRGCVKKQVPGEHHPMVGGTWWYIDHAGAEVERQDLSAEEIARLETRSRLR